MNIKLVIFITLNVITVIRSKKILSDEIIAQINESPTSMWKAGYNFPKSTSIRELSKSFLMNVGDAKVANKPNQKLTGLEKDEFEANSNSTNLDDDLPKSFDLRKAYPYCPMINSIRNQYHCGSCWAVAAMSAVSDRFCIASKGSISLNFSSVHHLSCCIKCAEGCKGTKTFWRIYDFYENNNLVTGGEFESDEGCQPYPIGPCSSYDKYGSFPCIHEIAMTPKCRRNKCTNEYYEYETEQTSYKIKKCKIPSLDEKAIRREIYNRGTVITLFDVFYDLFYYRSGIYTHWLNKGEERLGQHVVRLIGWDETEDGIKYWIAANSWGRGYGENGFFNILRGENEVDIEREVLCAIPDI